MTGVLIKGGDLEEDTHTYAHTCVHALTHAHRQGLVKGKAKIGIDDASGSQGMPKLASKPLPARRVS